MHFKYTNIATWICDYGHLLIARLPLLGVTRYLAQAVIDTYYLRRRRRSSEELWALKCGFVEREGERIYFVIEIVHLPNNMSLNVRLQCVAKQRQLATNEPSSQHTNSPGQSSGDNGIELYNYIMFEIFGLWWVCVTKLLGNTFTFKSSGPLGSYSQPLGHNLISQMTRI